jgi:hypothetical protein
MLTPMNTKPMPTLINFHQSAKRHFYDADLLLMHHERSANAGQLYGFAAECGIKSLLIWQGYPSEPTGDLKKRKSNEKGNQNFRKHIHELVQNIHSLETFLDGRSGARYRVMLPSLHTFSDWHTDQRYYADSALPKSTPNWRQSAEEIMRMLDQALLDGASV